MTPIPPIPPDPPLPPPNEDIQDNTNAQQLDPQPQPQLGNALTDYNDMDIVATLEELRIAQAFIAALQEASLDQDNGMDVEARDRLRDPITKPVNLDENPNVRAGIDIFLDTTNASDTTYTDVRASVNSYLGRLGIDLEENSVPLLHSVKKIVGDITGVHSITTDMCENTCIAYTGPFANLESCPKCNSPQYTP
ncbi:hypothetical protein B0H34DRAFT_801527 [Crassisporium funariophilum]|nr:hypothetical protein B0H34DRAFT_801527 [Crassisporium funariophilum]